MKRKLLGVILLMMLLFPITKVDAAGVGITTSTKSTNPGNKVYIKVSASGVAGKFTVSSSNSNVLSGGGTDWIENDTKTYEFTAKSIGSATITVTPVNAAYSDGSGKVTGSKSVNISVVKPREKSTNNNLKSLSVEGYELKPEFSKDTLEYSVEVVDDKETIKINAEKEDGYASLDGDGEVEVAEGMNKLEVKVTSETGVEKKYILNVNVKDSNPIAQKVGGERFTLVKRSKSLVLPEGLDSEKFETSTIKIGENEIPALVSEELKLTLIGLKDKNGAVYLYEVVDGKIKDKYEMLTSKGLTIKFKEPKKILDGYKKTTIKIGNKEYTAYQNKYKDYALIYGTNTETKEDGWYSYNIKEKSIQSYAKDMIDDMNKNYNDKINTYTLIIIGLSGISVLLLLIVIILAVTKKKNKTPKDMNIKPNQKEIEDIKEETLVDKLEDTKEIDASEIIINKIEEPKKEEPIKIEEPKKDKKKNKNKENQVEESNSEFLNTEDLKEILQDAKPVKEEQPVKLSRKEKRALKKASIEDPEMAMDFLDIKKKR